MASTYDVITDRIIAQLEKGTAPWRKPWGDVGEPANLISQKAYRGVNWILLASAGYGSRYWLTFNQAKDLGAFIRKGEHGMPVVFFTVLEKDKDTPDADTPDAPEKDTYRVLKYYTVFNLQQVDGLPEKTLAKIRDSEKTGIPFAPLQACEEIVDGYQDKPEISYGLGRAFYRPATDTIGMPARDAFDSVPEFYSTLFHELAHSTGAQKRLGRFDPTDDAHFGSVSYSREELVAEITAAFLCGRAHIEPATLENSAAYCQGWINRLKGDSKLIVLASGAAQKAADYILGSHKTAPGPLPAPPSVPLKPEAIPAPVAEDAQLHDDTWQITKDFARFEVGKCTYRIDGRKVHLFSCPTETKKSIATFDAAIRRAHIYAPNTWRDAKAACPRCNPGTKPLFKEMHTIGQTYKVCHTCQKISEV